MLRFMRKKCSAITQNRGGVQPNKSQPSEGTYIVHPNDVINLVLELLVFISLLVLLN